MGVTLEKDFVESVIENLKSIKVDGYESMEKLVGMVALFERMKAAMEEEARERARAAREGKQGAANTEFEPAPGFVSAPVSGQGADGETGENGAGAADESDRKVVAFDSIRP